MRIADLNPGKSSKCSAHDKVINAAFSGTFMARTHTVRIHDRQEGTYHTVEVPEDRYILHTAESQGVELPFSCRNGACTTCAVRVISGELYQPEAMGLSPELQRRGYALLCVSYARSDLEVETQDEDEVYELQFGRYFGKGRVKRGLPLDED
jgi:ferredoxin